MITTKPKYKGWNYCKTAECNWQHRSVHLSATKCTHACITSTRLSQQENYVQIVINKKMEFKLLSTKM